MSRLFPTRSQRLGDLQHAILRILWNAGEATAADVHKALEPERGLAPTTIATMLVKMEKKGVVHHRRDGRRFVYGPVVSEAEIRSSMVSDLMRRLFDDNPAALVSHLLAEHEVDAGELAELRTLIEHHESARPGLHQPNSEENT